jgi:Flp pilus assembly protein protease CpaA
MIGLAEGIVLAALVFAAVIDLKTKEVPDWLSYSLIFSGLGIAMIKSVISMDFLFLLYSLIGLGFFVALAYLMFYAGQWGGGDSKLMMGIGALLGLQVSSKQPFIELNQVLVAFLANLLIVALLYGLIYSAALAVIHRKKFVKQFRQLLNNFRLARRVALALAVAMIALIFFMQDALARLTTAMFVLVTLITLYLWLFVKAVENSSLYKFVSPEKLVEGDWVVRDVKVGKRIVCSQKSLGITKEQIRQLIKLKRQRKLKKVLIKEGIPFVPSFLVAFVITLAWGNLLLLLF